ncbi:type II secretion system minor pseudopilin GspI [Paraburkholderia sp.]|uniref:type II secretion system minor pseudopilin GspI n=1 Tax=Paraburkholderia sp. TaxID=1926495 RepID=UPI0023981D95|nr:type II secretion system minor pseudopilin GspI [Paraburkholderia sp.]MDE1181348.1 type II secretion system minor pseudopilin GspI [Paraburkholderia sp.]
MVRPVAATIAARTRAQRGFTMIEVLVALAIIAIALAASLRAVGSLASGEADLHNRLLAGWSADNTLAQLRLAHSWPDVGAHSFDCSQGNLQLICTENVTSTPNPVFRRVEVSVTMPGRRGNLAQMVTVVANETNRSL